MQPGQNKRGPSPSPLRTRALLPMFRWRGGRTAPTPRPLGVDRKAPLLEIPFILLHIGAQRKGGKANAASVAKSTKLGRFAGGSLLGPERAKKPLVEEGVYPQTRLIYLASPFSQERRISVVLQGLGDLNGMKSRKMSLTQKVARWDPFLPLTSIYRSRTPICLSLTAQKRPLGCNAKEERQKRPQLRSRQNLGPSSRRREEYPPS